MKKIDGDDMYLVIMEVVNTTKELSVSNQNDIFASIFAQNGWNKQEFLQFCDQLKFEASPKGTTAVTHLKWVN